ncbi:MAG: type II toxin-antitoxin system RelE/ParE family toxin [Elusimicrobiota bacterium]|jgi:putative addiction module killer protein|nr:type II toxin-antitoxin system RelE/ParE family toxin [Elusimicrobiota bacterium]
MKIEMYTTTDGKKPFSDWFDGIKNEVQKIRVIKKLEFLRIENFSNCKPVGEDVFERKLFSIRIYFLKYKNAVILLLLGGEKDKQQQRDIEKAKKYAKDFLEKEQKNEKKQNKNEKF